jgi:hypothetical protein
MRPWQRSAAALYSEASAPNHPCDCGQQQAKHTGNRCIRLMLSVSNTLTAGYVCSSCTHRKTRAMLADGQVDASCSIKHSQHVSC